MICRRWIKLGYIPYFPCYPCIQTHSLSFLTLICFLGLGVARASATFLTYNPPGTSYVIYLFILALMSIKMRTFQAGLQTFRAQYRASVLLAILGLVLRLAFKSRIYLTCKVAKRLGIPLQPDEFESVRGRRGHTDILICINQAETLGIALSQILSGSLHTKFCPSAEPISAVRFFVGERMLLWLLIHLVCESLVLFVEQRYDNLPIARVWAKRWKDHLGSLFVISAISAAIFSSNDYSAIADIRDRELCASPNFVYRALLQSAGESVDSCAAVHNRE